MDGIVSAIGNVASGVIGANAAKDAADAQKDSAKKAIKFQKEMWQQGREDVAPWRTSGAAAQGTLADLYGLNGPQKQQAALDAYRVSPDYKVGYDEGLHAIDASAAARGMLLSGNQVKATERFGADYATKKFDDYANRLARISGMGQASASQNSAQSIATGGMVGNQYLNQGEAIASGAVGQGNVLANGVSSLTDNLAYYLKKNPSIYSGGGYQDPRIY